MRKTAQKPQPILEGNRNQGNLPVHTLRHRNIKAAIWRNDTDKGPMYNVTIVRSFRDQSGEWKDSHSISYDDIMNVYEAHAYISSLRATDAEAARAAKEH
jgi:hypothetical protein